MSKPQLYIKNDKGRYEPYKLPEPDVSETAYKKINGKYEPVGRFFNRDYLTEGVWVVYCDHAFCNGKYLKEKFRMEKVSDLQYPTIAELGGLESAIHQAWEEHTAYKLKLLHTTGYSEYDGYYFMVRRTLEILKEKGNKQ
jgi:hypothetical protein